MIHRGQKKACLSKIPNRVRLSSKSLLKILLLVPFLVLAQLQATMAHAANSTDIHGFHLLPLELVQRILTHPWQDETHIAVCETLIAELTEEELEVAARTSYMYWVATTAYPTIVTPEIRQKSAMKEARRHFVSEDFEYNKALLSLRQTFEFQKNIN
jgi:hypothetical protein